MGVTTAAAVAAAATSAVVGFAAGYGFSPSSAPKQNDPLDGMVLSKGGWKKKKVNDASAEMTEGDAKKGAALFKAKCATCHTCVPGGPTIQGPNLYGIMGKEAGKSKGFKFTKNMQGAKDENGEAPLKWDNESMYKWLENPKQMVKGTSMAFPGFKKETDRLDVIAYLHTLSEDKAAEVSKKKGH